MTGYRGYVHRQAELLVKRVRPFVAAVTAGDVAAAKRQFAAARAPDETIEPVTESFGNLDPEIDVRVNDVKRGERWTGFHRIEQALWHKHTTKSMGPIADKLLRDCIALERKTATLDYQPDELANGANGLLGEVASSKISGEEDRYSHTDLSDIQANVGGSQTTFGLLAPALKDKDPALASTIGRCGPTAGSGSTRPGKGSRASSARSCSWSAPTSWRASYSARGAARTASPPRGSSE